MTTRRGFFGLLAGAIAAPYVARAGVLMPVHTIASTDPVIVFDFVGDSGYDDAGNGWYRVWRRASEAVTLDPNGIVTYAQAYVKPSVKDGKIYLPSLGVIRNDRGPNMVMDFPRLEGGLVIGPGENYQIGAACFETEPRPTPYISTEGMKHHPMRQQQHIRSVRG